jgi:hypothetical protein
MSDEPGYYDFDVTVSIIYGEAVKVVMKKVNLS